MLTSTQYFIQNNRRYVLPFDHEYRQNVRKQWVGRSILDVFNSTFPFQPKNFHEQAIRNQRLVAYSKSGERLPLQHLLKLGDVVSHLIHTHEPSVRVPSLQIIGQNEDVIAICKSSSLPVHACGRYHRNTVTHILSECYGITELRTVHRLDRVTSGVVILAKTKQSARDLSDSIKNKELRKEYLARVIGEFPTLPNEQYMTCNAVLAQHPVTKKVHVPTEMQTDGLNPQAATTHFRRLAVGTDIIQGQTVSVSLIHCLPLTGRTHQIRVHLQHLGYPIVDDPLYGSDSLIDIQKKDGEKEAEGEKEMQKKKNDTCSQVSVVSVELEMNKPREYKKQKKEIVQQQQVTATKQDEIESNTSSSVQNAMHWNINEYCPHCPNIEPDVNEGSGSQRDPRSKRVGSSQKSSDGICLHAMAYYYPNKWVWATPLALIPEWAKELLEKDGGKEQAELLWMELNELRSFDVVSNDV